MWDNGVNEEAGGLEAAGTWESPDGTYIKIPCPARIFDLGPGEEAYIWRLRRVAIARVDAFRALKEPGQVYQSLAAMVPRWQGIKDAETGEALAHPADNAEVFTRLDMEQLRWVSEMLQVAPGKAMGRPRPGPTS